MGETKKYVTASAFCIEQYQREGKSTEEHKTQEIPVPLMSEAVDVGPDLSCG
jgi:hypothetical protein